METQAQDKTARSQAGGASAPYGRVWDLIAASCRTHRPRALAAWWVGGSLRMVAGRDAVPYRLAFKAAMIEVRDGWPLVGEGERLAELVHRPLANVDGVPCEDTAEAVLALYRRTLPNLRQVKREEGGRWVAVHDTPHRATETPPQAEGWSIAHQGPSWGAWRDGEIPEGWEAWETGLTWEEAHDVLRGSVEG